MTQRVPNVKQLATLSTKKGRTELGMFIVEGERFVRDIPSETEIVCYVISDHRESSHSSAGIDHEPQRAPVIVLPEKRFKALSDTVTPQGILAVCKMKPYTPQEILRTDERSVYILCENVSDPGNIGTIMRTAHAFSATGIFFSENCADIYSPKVMRSAAGAALRLPCAEGVKVTEIADLLAKSEIPLIVTDLRGDSLEGYRFPKRCCIALGNEAHGVSHELLDVASVRLKIPMDPTAESLNVAVAGGIMMYFGTHRSE